MTEPAKDGATADKTKFQITVVFDTEDAREAKVWAWVEKVCKAYAIRPTQLAKSAITHGAKEAEARAKKRYLALRDIDSGLFDEPAAADPPAPPANDLTPVDAGKVYPESKHPGTCRECSEKVPVGSWIRHYSDSTIRCQKCEGRAA